MRTPDDFLNNCGVLPTTMMLCSLFMCALGFYGYTAFGDDIKQTITLNMPNER
jgi:proton-coupled amino acid transporter